MDLIESISDDMITIFLILFTFFLIVISWLSTNVREFPFPGNLLVIERNSRRFYTTLDGSQTLVSSQTATNSVTATTTVINNANSNSTNPGLIVVPTSRQSAQEPNSQISDHESSFSINSRNEIVDEIVEQALVENLLEGTLFTPGDISSTSHDTSTAIASNESLNINNNIESSSITSTNSTSSSFDNQANNNHQSIEETSNEELKQDKAIGATQGAADESPMNILIRFVNEREMKIQAKPTDTILLIKRTHFENELSSNKIVRFIYQGQFLCDKNTIKSYNIKDKTTIHCHITTKPASMTDSSSNESNTNNTTLPSISVTSNPRARNVQNHQIATINRINQMSASTEATTRADNPSTTDNRSTSSNGIVTDSTDLTPQTQGNNGTSESSASSTNTDQQQTNITIINVELSHLLLPLFAILISSLWYFRLNFKHFFSPLSTLILVVFTFVYGVFLINNVHATTAIAAANFFFHNRIWRNNRNILRTQSATGTTTSAATTVPIQANSTSSNEDLD